ncbi:MAG: hypothetical protein LBH40_00425 [Alphaproteobacteria bacterium]|nr:hypothetical protein [Alphaproteobacteria bacterium]
MAQRSNTANVDPRSINFADVKKRLEDKIDRINSYQSKKGTFRDANSGGGSVSPSSFQAGSGNRPAQNNANRFAEPQRNTGFSPASQTTPQSSPYSSGSGGYSPSAGYSADDRNSRFASSNESRLGGRGSASAGAREFNSEPRQNEAPAQSTNPYNMVRRDSGTDNSASEQRYGQSSPNISIVGPSLADYYTNSRATENKDREIPENSYQKQLDFLEQERLDDLRNRAGDSKLSYLADNLNKIEGRIENIQNTQGFSGLLGPMDVSLEIIQRKLDKLEQDRIDSLRSKIDQERSRDLEKSIEKLGAKIEDSYNAGNTLYNRVPSDLEIIQKKLDRLEQDKLDTLKSRLEEDRSSEIMRNLEKIEAKLTSSVDKTVLDKTAYLEALSKEDLLRKIEKLEQDRIDDIRSLMEQEKALLLNKQIEKLESKIEQALSNSAVEKSSIEASAELARKLERIEQAKIEEARVRKEEEKLVALSRSLSNIESKLGEKQAVSTIPDAMGDFLNSITDRLQRLEQNKNSENLNPSFDKYGLERSLSNLENKIEKISQPAPTYNIDSRYASILEGIERKLSRLERDRVDEYKERSESDKLSGLSKSLERIEGSLVSKSSYPIAVEGDGLGKKFDKLEQEIRSSLERDKLSNLQRSLDKIETKLDSTSKATIAPAVSNDFSNAFAELSKRLDSLEKKRLEEYIPKENSLEDSKLVAILEKIDNKLKSVSENTSNKSEVKKDPVIEEIQRKLSKLEETKSKDLLLQAEKEKFNNFSNLVEKLDSKINNLSSNNSANKTSSGDEVAKLADKIAKLEKNRLEEAKEKQNLERFNNISNYMEKLDSKLSNISQGNVNKPQTSSSELTQLADKIAKIEQNRFEETKEKQNLDRFSSITSYLEKLEDRLSAKKEATSVDSSQSAKLDELSKQVEKQQEKITELQSKLEKEKFDSLNRHLQSLEQKIDEKNNAVKEINLQALEELKKKTNEELLENKEVNSIFLEIKNRVDSLEAQKNEAERNAIFTEISNRLSKLETHNLESKNNNQDNPLLLELKTKLDNLSSHKEDINNPLFLAINTKLESLVSQKDNGHSNILLEIKNHLNSITQQKNEGHSPVLLEINNKIDKLSLKENDSDKLLLLNLQNRVNAFEQQKNEINNASFLEIKKQLDEINSKNYENVSSILTDVKDILENLKAQKNEVPHDKELAEINYKLNSIIEQKKDYHNPLLDSIKNRLDSLEAKVQDTDNPLLVELKNKIDNLSLHKEDTNNPLFLELKKKLDNLLEQKENDYNNAIVESTLSAISNRIDSLEAQKDEAERSEVFADINNRLNNLETRNLEEKNNNQENPTLIEIKNILSNLSSKNTTETNNSFLKELTDKLEKNNNLNNAILIEIKDSLNNLDSQKSTARDLLLDTIKNRLDNLQLTVVENSSSKDDSTLDSINSRLDSLISQEKDSNTILLLELKNKIDSIADQKNDSNTPLLDSIKNRLDNIEFQKNEFYSKAILSDINNRLSNLEAKNNPADNSLLLEIKAKLDNISLPKEDNNNNILFLELKNKLDNLSLPKEEVNSSLLFAINQKLDSLTTQKHDNYENILLEIKNHLNALTQQKHEAHNSLLLELKNKLDNISLPKEEVNSPLLLAINHKLETLAEQKKDNHNNDILENALSAISNRIDSLEAQKSEAERNEVLADINNRLSNLEAKNNSADDSLLLEIKAKLDNISLPKEDNNNNILFLELKNKLDNLLLPKEEVNSPLLFAINQKLDSLTTQKHDNYENILLEIKNHLNALTQQKHEVSNYHHLLIELKNKIDNLSLHKESASNPLLIELKDKLNDLSKQKEDNYNNAVLESNLAAINNRIDTLELQKSEAEKNALLVDINNRLSNLETRNLEFKPNNTDNHTPILLKINQKLDSINSKSGDVNTPILLEIKNKLDNLSLKDNNNNHLLLLDLQNRLSNFAKQDERKDSPLLLELKNKIDGFTEQKNNNHNPIFDSIKSRLDNIEFQNNESYSKAILLDINNRLSNLESQNLEAKNNTVDSTILLEIKNHLYNLSQPKNDNPILLEIKNKLDSIASKNHNSEFLIELKNILDNFKQHNNNATNESLLFEIKNRLEKLPLDINPLWLEINHKLDNLNSKNNQDTNYNILVDVKNAIAGLVSQGNNHNMLWGDLKNKLENLNLQKNDVNTPILLEIKEQLTKQSLQSQNINSLYLEEIRDKLKNLSDKNSSDTNNILKELKDILINLKYQNKETDHYSLLVEIKNILNNLSVKTNEYDKDILKDIKNSLGVLTADKTNFAILPTNQENNGLSDYLIKKNNEILEDISLHLAKLDSEVKNLASNMNVSSNPDLHEKSIELIDRLQNKYFESIDKIEFAIKGFQGERSLKENNIPLIEDIKNLLVEFDKPNHEIKNLLAKDKEALETILSEQEFIRDGIKVLQDKDTPIIEDIKSLLSEVNNRNQALNNSADIEKQNLANITQKMDLFFASVAKIEEAIIRISNNESFNEEYKQSLEETFSKLKEDNLKILNEQGFVRDGIKILQDKDAPIIEDIKSLLSEVNNRNQALNNSADIEKQNLANITQKMDLFFASVAKIEEAIIRISNNESFNEEYKQSLEETFAKLKEDHLKIIAGLQDNTQQSSLFSEKAETLMHSLKEDMRSISQIEQKSILEEFANLRGIVLEFKDFIKNQEINKIDLHSSFGKLLSNLDDVSKLQEETLSYFTSLDSKMESRLVDLQNNSTQGHNNILSEIKLYLEDATSRANYFNQLKDKIDQNNLVIAEFLNKSGGADKELLNFAEEFKTNLDSLSKTMEYLFEIHNKQTNDLNSLMHRTDKSKEEITGLIKDISGNSSQKIMVLEQGLSNLANNMDMISSKTAEIGQASQDIKNGVVDLKNGVVEVKKDINANLQENTDISFNKLQSLSEELSNMDASIKTLVAQTDDIRIEIKENKTYQEKNSDLIKLILSSVEDINFDSTLNNMLEKVSVIEDKQIDLGNLIGSFQKEIKSNLSPFVSDKGFIENFNKFTDFNDKGLKTIKDSIKSFNDNLNMFLVEDKIMTNEQLVELLTSFEELLSFQDNFFKIYSLNSENLMNFAKKTEQKVDKINVAEADNIHTQVKNSIVDISPKDKKTELSSLVSSNNAKNSKKVDLLANMDYLNKQITKKTTDK